jgi:hypothetical protein
MATRLDPSGDQEGDRNAAPLILRNPLPSAFALEALSWNRFGSGNAVTVRAGTHRAESGLAGRRLDHRQRAGGMPVARLC